MLELQEVMKSTWKWCTVEPWPMKCKTLCMCTDTAGLGLHFRIERNCYHPLSENLRWGRHCLWLQAGHTIGDLYKVKRFLVVLHDFQPSAVRPSCHMILFRNVSDSHPHSGRSKRVTLLYALSASSRDNFVSLNSLPPYLTFTPSHTFQWAQSHALSKGLIYQAD